MRRADLVPSGARCAESNIGLNRRGTWSHDGESASNRAGCDRRADTIAVAGSWSKSDLRGTARRGTPNCNEHSDRNP
jgi:hypothetical protein